MNSTLRGNPNARLPLTLLGALFLFACGAVVCMLFSSMAPSQKALALRDRVRVPALEPASYTYVPNPRAGDAWPSELLFVRQHDGRLDVFEVPTYAGRFTMPDQRWVRAGPACRDFSPDFQLGQIRCKDAEASEWVRDNLRWTLAGQSLTRGYVEDMIVAQGRIEEGEFVLGSR